ncbi:protein jag [Halanaerobiaceae bacterium Z-7014]|uniref:RNA-binding protein KhpB n=1 Tax=Halonatronomonas betaini TaxID=2778430 RepID=A0A931AVU6_9FIRM|nr:RNA-binding cell elongation regulator Jag/EloR [Halonatronomonas betaini]MBF8437700.1 protein jag [Halonatronomonas betaini]
MVSCKETGNSVEEAIDKALKKLDLSRQEAEINIIDEGSKGFLGLIGGKEAVVEVTKKIIPSEIGKNFLEEIFSSSDLNVEVEYIESKSDDKQLYFNLSSSELGLVIGHRGETLDALQYLTSLAVNRETDDYFRIMLDAEGYRERRKETLERLANKMKNKALETGRKVMLDPMPPHERRIIHLAIKDDDRVKSYSEGEEPFRKVMIEKV